MFEPRCVSDILLLFVVDSSVLFRTRFSSRGLRVYSLFRFLGLESEDLEELCLFTVDNFTDGRVSRPDPRM